MRMRMLCATDLTQRSDDAVRRAAMLAKQMNGEVLFVHAVSEVRSGRIMRMKVNRAHVRLLSQSERAMRHAPSDAHTAVRIGQPVEAIAAAAEEWSPDLIVMAAPTQRRFDALIGTTAERVIRATQRPLLIVSEPADEQYEKLVIATDLSENSTHAARTIGRMGLLERAHAWIVHGFDPLNHGLSNQFGALGDNVIERQRQWREAISRQVAQHVRDAGVDRRRVQILAEPAAPLSAIRNALERARPQLLVIGVSRWFMLKRLIIGSVADQVLRSITCDVLAIPPSVSRVPWLRAA